MPILSLWSFADSIPPLYQPPKPGDAQTGLFVQTELPSYTHALLLSQEEIGRSHQSIGYHSNNPTEDPRRLAGPGSSNKTKSQNGVASHTGASGNDKVNFQKGTTRIRSTGKANPQSQKEGSPRRVGLESVQMKSSKRGPPHAGVERASPVQPGCPSSMFSPSGKREIDTPDRTGGQKIQIFRSRRDDRTSSRSRRRGSNEGFVVNGDNNDYDDHDDELGQVRIQGLRPVHNQRSHRYGNNSEDDQPQTDAESGEDELRMREELEDSNEDENKDEQDGSSEDEGDWDEDEEGDKADDACPPQLIPKPDGEVGRPGRGGYNLSGSLGWAQKDYQQFMDVVKKSMNQALDVGKSFGEQQPESIDFVCKLVTKKLPDLTKYENYWPIKDAIRSQLKYQRTQKRFKESIADAELGRRFKKAARK